MAKVLTTSDLITTSLRRGLIPSDQATFTCCDIIEMMNEELSIHIVPMVLRAHEEYYVIDEDVSVCLCEIRYKIPYRAVGNKLRDVQFVDDGGNYYEMTRLSVEDRPECQNLYYNDKFLSFYLESDDVVLLDKLTSTGNLRMSYYLKPNQLVKNSRSATITAIGNQHACIAISCFSNLVCGSTTDSITIAGIGFSATACCVTLGCATFRAACSNAATATSLAAQINGNSSTSALVTATVACCTIVKVTADASTTCLTVSYTNNTGCVGITVTCIRKTFTMTCLPCHYAATTIFDFIQGKSPNKIILFDKTRAAICTTLNTLTFNISDLKVPDLFSGTNTVFARLSVGDYIMKAEETIIPQLPTELHPILAQRVAVKMLEALGDTEGMQNAQKELERMEYNAQTLIDNRVEGSPQKVRNMHSILRSSLYRRRGF